MDPNVKLKKYRVANTNIMDSRGNKVREGGIAELDTATAKHYNKLGFLRPLIEDDDEEQEQETENDNDGGDEKSAGDDAAGGAAKPATADATRPVRVRNPGAQY